jgi:NAD(P)-dependent dehydrogenase (short-subunit alcohol dehydrogenase family)
MDVLSNCAGITSHGPFEVVALDHLLSVININANGTIIGIHLSMELRRPRSRMAIVAARYSVLPSQLSNSPTTVHGAPASKILRRGG